MKAPTITTPRLSIGPMEEGDAPDLYRYRSDPEVCRFQSWAPKSLNEALELIKSLEDVEFGTPETWFQLAIRRRVRTNLIGDIGLHFLSAESRQVEIGYTVSSAHQRQGFAREAVEAVLGYLFKTMAVHRVIASVDPRNEPSRALLAGLGMRQEGHFVRSLWFKGEWADDQVFALLRDEWLGEPNGDS